MISKLSRFYGADPSIVLAGGGNTSCKVGERLYVKASGTSLATMTPDGFVTMDRPRLEALANATLDSDPDKREAHFQTAIAAARCEPQRGQRPSVEVLLHHLLPGTYVVHSHATIANALTCHKDGRRLAEEIFGSSILWLPYVDPGFTLAQALKAGAGRPSAAKRQRGGVCRFDGESRADCLRRLAGGDSRAYRRSSEQDW